MTSYFISSSHPFFGPESRSWMETSAFAGLALSSRRVTLEVVGLGIKTTGRDPYGTGSEPAGDPDAATLASSEWGLGIDRASMSIAVAPEGELPLTVTVGRQRIEIGSQFLIGDGVYDGFARGLEQGVYHNPRKSFDAVRARAELAGTRLDAFGYLVSPTWDAAGGKDGRVFGLDLSRRFERLGSSVALGAFHRSSRSDLDNDMTVLDVRVEQAVPRAHGLRVSGELVAELGRCRNTYYCTTPGQKMSELAWHAELRYEDTLRTARPSLEVGAVHYSEDFTPLATGFADWGRWYLGNQIAGMNSGAAPVGSRDSFDVILATGVSF